MVRQNKNSLNFKHSDTIIWMLSHTYIHTCIQTDTNVGQMGRRKFHGGQFSGECQLAKEIKNEGGRKQRGPISALKGPRETKDILKAVNELENIDKLSRDCKRLTTEKVNLKRTIQTLRKS